MVVGGTSITVPSTTGYTNSSIVQIDSGVVSEVVILNASGGTTATTLYFSNYPLRFAHGSAATVATVTGPYTHTFAVLNSTAGYGGANGAQPPTHSFTDNTYLTPGVYARTYPGACVGQIEINGNAEGLFMGKAFRKYLVVRFCRNYPHELDHVHRPPAELAVHPHHRHGRQLRRRGMDNDPEKGIAGILDRTEQSDTVYHSSRNSRFIRRYEIYCAE